MIGRRFGLVLLSRGGPVGFAGFLTAALLLEGSRATSRSLEAARISPLSVRWGQQVGLIRSLALSPGGEHLLWLDWHGQVNCVAKSGRLRWARRAAAASCVVTGPQGEWTALFRPDSHRHRRVQFVDSAGEDRHLLECDSPVKCVAFSRDGSRAAVGARSGSLYMLLRQDGGLRKRHTRAAGRVVQLFFGRHNTLYYVTAAPPGLGRIASDGTLDWYTEGPPTSEFLVSASPLGGWIAVAERTRNPRPSSRLQLWNGQGEIVWSRPLNGWPTAVRAAHSAARIVVGLESQTVIGGAPRTDRSLVCYGMEGTRLWRKGGTFLDDPLFVTMAEGGEWVVSLGRQFAFHLWGDQGEFRWRRSARAPVQIAVGSADGSSVGVAFADGRLAWLSIPTTPRE